MNDCEKVILGEDERIDDLLAKGLRIIQNRNKYCFCSDAVEIANFAEGGSGDLAADLGSGTGIISILLAGKKSMRVSAIEIQPDMAEMSRRSVALNNLDDKITVYNARIQDIPSFLERGSHGIVVCNPPYRKLNSGEASQAGCIAASRHEIHVKLQEIVAAAAYLLSTGGRFYIVHQTERMAEVFYECSKLNLQPKVLQILTPNERKQPHIFMLKCIKDGKAGLLVNKQRAVLPFDTEG